MVRYRTIHRPLVAWMKVWGSGKSGDHKTDTRQWVFKASIDASCLLLLSCNIVVLSSDYFSIFIWLYGLIEANVIDKTIKSKKYIWIALLLQSSSISRETIPTGRTHKPLQSIKRGVISGYSVIFVTKITNNTSQCSMRRLYRLFQNSGFKNNKKNHNDIGN